MIMTKKIIVVLMFFTLVSSLIGKNTIAMARIDINSRNAKIDLTPGIAYGGGFIAKGQWLKSTENYNYYLYSCSKPIIGYKWEKYKLSFTPGKSGVISIGLYTNGKGANNWVCWDDIKIEGAKIINGDFEANRNGKVTGWNISPKNYIKKNGNRYIKTSSTVNRASQNIIVQKDKEVIITAKIKKYYAPMIPINIRSVVNMGLADEVAGDGKGGWSDQGGPERDMRDFDTDRVKYGNIYFKIINPKNNNGKAVITLDSKYAKTGINKVEIPVSTKAKTCRYLYLLHTSCWNNKPSGTILGTVKVNFNDGSTRLFPVKAGIELLDWATAGNVKNGMSFPSKKTNNTFSKNIFASKLYLGESNKKIRSISIRSNGKVVWIIMGVTISDRVVKLESPRISFKKTKGWKAVDMSDINVRPGTALDFSRLIEPGPAGKYGRVIIGKKSILAFEKKPNKEIRFMISYNQISKYHSIKNRKARKKKISLFTRQVRIQGYNLLRYWPDLDVMFDAESNLAFNKESVDDLDFQIAEAKKNGIYAFLDLATYGLYMKGRYRSYAMRHRNIAKVKMFLGDTKLRHLWQTGVKQLLNHVNPYTGLAWKDDPAIAFVDFYNEQKLGLILILNYNFDKLDAKTKQLCLKKWRQFLKERYKTTSALAVAWKQPKFSKGSFDNMPLPYLPLVSTLSKRRQIDNDYSLFLMKLQSETMAWYSSVVRDIGYKGLCTSSNVVGDFKDGKVRSEFCDLVIANGYFAHPSKFFSPGSRCHQNSSIKTMGKLFRSFSSVRLWDRPFIITEWGHAFWNQYQYEAGLLNPAYFAFQGFNGALVHAGSVQTEANSLSCFSVGHSPIGRANEFLASCLFQRGDVKKYKHRVKLLIDKKYLDNGCNTARSVSGDQSKIALACGFGLYFQGWTKPAGAIKAPVCDLTIPPLSGGTVTATGWTSGIIDKKSSIERLTQIYNKLRSKGILGPNNISNPRKGIFQTDTGEITLFCNERKIKIKTARTEGVTLDKGKSEKIDILHVIKTSEPAAIAICSVDDKALKKSDRMVLVYSTFAVNTGMELSSDLVTLFKRGTTPVLMKTAKLKISLQKQDNKKYELYALGFNGSRREQIPIKISKNRLVISIDTAKLKNGPTPFFEIISK